MNNAPTSNSVVKTGAHNVRQQQRAISSRGGVSTLMYAAQQGNVDRVRQIIRTQSSTLFSRDRTGKSALHYCSTSGNLCAAQAADLLVMAAPDLVDGRDEDGFTPLHLAVIAGNMQLVTFLLANKADVNAVDNEKHSVVHWATVCGETAALRAVLAAGAPVSTPDVHGGYPLHYAAQMCGGEGRDSGLGMQVLQTLLTHSDIVVSIIDGDKRQPLLWAASAGSTKAVLALIRAGANVESADKDGLTALHCAASRGHTDCIDSLLTLCGASPDVIDSNGCTALHYAVTLGHADATALLLAHGADSNRQDRKGRSPAHCGCAKGQFETVKLIGARGANLWLRNARGDLPLHEAAASGRRELVRWLLAMRPSQVNARNNDGRCPLHMAALNDNADMCKILLDAGAQINPILRTSKNIFMTPLDCALQRGFRSTAKYLQLHGGVPANRLGSQPNNNQANSALSLQIRDDITFWGDTSSDSERENGENEKNKRVYKKKLAYKLERKRATLSGGSEESIKAKGVKSDQSEKANRKIVEKHSKGTASKPSSVVGKKSSSRLDYSNEIIINGKTEINIHQTKEIVMEKEAETQPTPNNISKKTSSAAERPKSAKHSKLSGKLSAKPSAKAKTKASELKPTLKDQSTNTSDEASLITPEVKQKLDVHMPEAQQYPDQQSLMSNTSEDVEEAKPIIVEAAIHEPPKKFRNEVKNVESVLQVENVEKSVVEVGSEATKDQSNEIGIEKKKQEEEIIDTATNAVSGSDKAASVSSNAFKVKDEELQVKSEELQIKNEELPVKSAELQVKGENLQVGRQELQVKGDELQVNEEKLQVTGEKLQVEDEKLHIKSEELQLKGEQLEDQPTNTGPKSIGGQELQSEVVEVQQGLLKTPAEQAVKITSGVEKLKSESVADVVVKVEQEALPDTELGQHEQELSSSVGVTEEILKTADQPNQTAEDIPNIVGTSSESAQIEGTVVEPEDPAVNQSEAKVIDTEKLTESPNEVTTIVASEDATEDKPKTKNQLTKVSDAEDSYHSGSSSSSSTSRKTHRSFRILDDEETKTIQKPHPRSRKTKTTSDKTLRSRSEETKSNKDKVKRSKIPTPLIKSTVLSKSDRQLDKKVTNDRKVQSSLDARVPSLPNIHSHKEPMRSDSNMSAPLLTSTVYSDNERGSGSELELETEHRRSSSLRKRRVKRRSRNRDATRSAGSDYESSNVVDSGFEPSPRSTRIPKWKNMSDRGVNMSSVTQSIQTNIRRYHLERKIFQQLLELKRHQIRAGQHNEAMLVKRAIDAYHQSCASTVGAGRYVPQDYTFKSFEKFLYQALRKLQKNGAEHLKGLPETPNPLHCTQSTHRCMHATHAYTGIPCAAYLPKMDHHTIPKIGFTSVNCKPGGFLPTINPKKAVTLELSHGADKQIISLPTDRLDQNKRYYVTFTVKGRESTTPPNEESETTVPVTHRHSKSD